MKNISKNILSVNSRILELSKDKKNKISFVAVTKTFPVEDVKEALSSGIIFDIAESKIQEALPKFEALSNTLNGINKHFIGHLQSNKAKKAVLNFDLIQSLDSIDLATDINRHAKDINKVQKCLIELKVSTEESKYGVSKDKIIEIYEHCISKCNNIQICGIMTIAPYFDDKELVRPYFKKANDIFLDIKNKTNDVNFKILSMGMSDDFEIAIQEGSNMVRVGTAIFGERNYDK